MPTSQSATARLITNRLVTVLRRRVVMTDKITKVLPIIVMIINKQKSTISTIFVHGQLSASALFWSVVFMFNHPVFREKEASKAHYTLRENILLGHIRTITHGWLSYGNLRLLLSIGGEVVDKPKSARKEGRKGKKFYGPEGWKLIWARGMNGRGLIRYIFEP